MAKPFPYEKAAYVLALGALFSKARACSICDVKSGTYDNWVQAKKTDNKLKELFNACFEKLNSEWQGEVVKTFNMQLFTIQNALAKHPFGDTPISPREKEAWAKCVAAMSGLLKSTGEMVIGGQVLLEEDTEEDEEEEKEHRV